MRINMDQLSNDYGILKEWLWMSYREIIDKVQNESQISEVSVAMATRISRLRIVSSFWEGYLP